MTEEPAPKATRLRRHAHARGRLAELVCAWHLRLRGWRVLGCRVHTPVGEIDIVARRGRLLAFIEVKARASLRDAAESLAYRQRQRIVRAAGAYLARYPSLGDLDVRFDAMLVAPWRLPRHLADAFRPEV